MIDQSFLDIIRATEQQAADLVGNARDAARLCLEEARVTAAGLVAQAREQAVLIRQQRLEEAEAEAQDLIMKAGEQAAASAARQITETGNRLEQAARMVAERIVSDNAHR